MKKQEFKEQYESLRSYCLVIENRELYVVFDEEKDQLYAGGATNCFIFREFVHDIDYNFDLDANLEALVEAITEKIILNTKVIEGFEIRAFSGFYGTIWEDSNSLSELQAYHEGDEGWDEVDSWDDIEFNQDEYQKDLLNDIVPRFCGAFNEIFGGDLEFIGGEIESPREYNFRNDELYVNMRINDYDTFCDNINKMVELYRPELTKKVKEDWSDRDGFWSFVENDFDKWDWEDDSQQLEILLYYLIQLDRDSRSQLERLEIDIWEDCEVRPESYWNIVYPNVSEN